MVYRLVSFPSLLNPTVFEDFVEKTAGVKQLYNDPLVCNRFDAWSDWMFLYFFIIIKFIPEMRQSFKRVIVLGDSTVK